MGSLLSTTVNLRLKDAVEKETGIKAINEHNFNLRFISVDGDDDYEAKSPIGLTYSVVRQTSGYKVRVYLPHSSEIIGRQISDLKDAQEICAKDFNDRLMKLLNVI